MAKSMNETSETCEPQTSPGSPSAISSPALADGVTRLDSPDGQMTDLFGLDRVLASPSPRAVGVPVPKMRVISGLSGARSSRSAALRRSLASKLVARMDRVGLTLWRATWKTTYTPLRRPIFQLRASMVSTSVTVCGGSLPIPTPAACDHKGSSRNPNYRRAKTRGFGAANLRDWFRVFGGWLYPPAAAVRSLMGYPAEWDACADMVMPSSRKSRKYS